MTTQTVERDPETGLALLPEGLIWKVSSTNRYLTLRLVRIVTTSHTRGIWWWTEEYTKSVEDPVMEDYYDATQLAARARTKEALAAGLATLSDTMYTEWKRRQDQWDLMRSFDGSYPPKNVNSV